MVNRILITGKIVVTSDNESDSQGSFTRISAIDSLLAQKFMSKEVFIHGEQLKKKICSILEKQYPKKIYKPTDKEWMIARVFGSGSGNRKMMGRLVFLDMGEVVEGKYDIGAIAMKSPDKELAKYTTVFELKMVYDIEEPSEFVEDMAVMLEGLCVIEKYMERRSGDENDSLRFYDIEAKLSGGYIDEALVDEANEILSKHNA